MPETKIYGASDDLIELEGQITEEFSHYGSYGCEEDPPAIIAFSDGTLLEVEYDKDGIWRIKRLAVGRCAFMLEPGSVKDDRPDVATIIGEVEWCVKSERGQYSPWIAKKAKQ